MEKDFNYKKKTNKKQRNKQIKKHLVQFYLTRDDEIYSNLKAL